MNAIDARLQYLQPTLAPAVAAPARREPPQRDFGTGYGRSSGYAQARCYSHAQAMTPFRFG